MFPAAINYQLKIKQVRFAPSLIVGKSEAHIAGLLETDAANNVCHFALIAEYDLQARHWSIGLPNFRWMSPVSQSLFDFRNIQSLPKKPIVFFALLVEKSSTGEAKTQQQQLDTITTGLLKNSPGISAIVVGRMFIDSAGGPIKWNFEKFLINEQALHRVDESLLRQIFKPNWERICYPCMPIVFSYNLNVKSPAAAV